MAWRATGQAAGARNGSTLRLETGVGKGLWRARRAWGGPCVVVEVV